MNAEDLKGKSTEELVALFAKSYNDKIDSISKLQEESATKNADSISTLKDEILKDRAEQIKSLSERLNYSEVEIKKLQKSNEATTTHNTTIAKSLAEHKETLVKIKDGSNDKLKFKAPATMLESTNISGGNVPVEQRIAGFNTIASRRVRLFDIVQQGTAESNLISWVYQANKDGAAGGTDEGALKNQIDFDLVVASESLKKRTAYIKVSEEMLDDVSFIESEINNELMRELLKDAEAQVYAGDGTGNNLNGIRTVATAFAAGSFAATVDNANFVDVLRVAADQIKVGEFESPTYILAHPSDVTALKLIKRSTTDKAYIDALQIIAGEMTVDGIPVLETTLVTQGEYMIGNFDFATVYSKGGITMEVGRENDDFTKNLVTILAEWRGLVVVKNNDRGAFVAGTIATDAAALETP